MSKWLINNPFFLLLLPLVAFILCCAYTDWPCSLQQTVPLGVAPDDTARAYYPVVLLSEPSERASTYRYLARVLDGLPTHPQVFVYMQKDSARCLPNKWDTILVYTHWQQPDSLPGFDYAAYLRKQGVSGTGYVPTWAWQMIASNQVPWWRTSSGWQQRLLQRYQQLGITGRELGTISALTLGYREDLDATVQRQFAAAGAMHVLAVSGLHTGILMNALMGIITLFGRRKPLYEQRGRRITQGCLVMLMLIAYALLTGCTPSVVRSVVMCCLVLLAMMTRRQTQMLNSVFAAAFFILVFRPMDLFAVSFQLSFAAILAIALFGQGWQTLSCQIEPHSSNRLLYKARHYVLGLIGMSLAAMIGTMPISLYYFGQISNYFLLTNLIVLPLAWLMMIGGLLTLTIGWWTPMGVILAWLLKGLTWLMNEGVGWIEGLPGATTMVVLTWPMLVVLIVINLCILVAWKHVATSRITWK